MKEYRKILFPYAYNILGSSEDAKDAIQDVLTNYLTSAKEGISNEKSYLIKGVINRAITLKSKKKRLSQQDVWLPEPIATEEADTNMHLSEIASYSLLVLLEQLNPKERAVFILKEGFGYSHDEIAEVLSSTVEHSRKLLSRAKSKVDPKKQPVKLAGRSTGSTLEMLEKYLHAIRGRDTNALERLLSQDIAFFADGGTKMQVVAKTCLGSSEVAPLLMYIYHQFQRSYSVCAAVVNHQPALLYRQDSQLIACQVFEVSPGEGKIQQINTVLDPEKLKSIQHQQTATRL